MQTVTVESVVTGWAAQDVYERLKDPDVYVACAPEQVKSVVNEEVPEADQAVTHWEIYFRNGVLRWSERDTYDDPNTTLAFVQTEGDFESFHGTWVIEATGAEEVLLTFTATFDFGVPSLEAIIDPVAIRVLRAAMGRIIGQLFGGTIREPAVVGRG